jgi:hypothetical protein
MAEDLQEHCVGNISHVATLYRAATGTGKRNNGLLIARRITITMIRDFLNDTINNCCRVGTILILHICWTQCRPISLFSDLLIKFCSSVISRFYDLQTKTAAAFKNILLRTATCPQRGLRWVCHSVLSLHAVCTTYWIIRDKCFHYTTLLFYPRATRPLCKRNMNISISCENITHSLLSTNDLPVLL